MPGPFLACCHASQLVCKVPGAGSLLEAEQGACLDSMSLPRRAWSHPALDRKCLSSRVCSGWSLKAAKGLEGQRMKQHHQPPAVSANHCRGSKTHGALTPGTSAFQRGEGWGQAPRCSLGSPLGLILTSTPQTLRSQAERQRPFMCQTRRLPRDCKSA